MAAAAQLCHTRAMIDYQLLARDPEAVLGPLQRRGVPPEQLAQLRASATHRREAIARADGLRHQLNAQTAALAERLRGGDKAALAEARDALRDLKAASRAAGEEQEAGDARLAAAVLGLPNLPDAAVPDGADAAGNRVEREVGARPDWPFAAADHCDILERLGMVDFERAAKLSGARFAVLRGAGARLERALAGYMLQMAAAHGYTEVAPPLLVRPEAMQAAGQYPKFIGESFETQDRGHVLIPTSEVPLVNLHRDEIFAEEALPVRYTAYTPCFRREAGAAGRDTRGLIRLHQFHKVELVAYTTPEQGAAELARLTGHAEAVLAGLGLPYRVVSLCTGDLGFATTRTYDLEVWLPGQGAYREISSCSSCGDFQARRGQIRYRPAAGAGRPGKPRLVHTLNGSALAVGRCMVAVVENYQQADGSVVVPPALRPFFGAERIVAGD